MTELLGEPDEESTPSKPGEKPAGGYLDSKDPLLVAHLMDAVDESRGPEERAEALCRAIETSGSASAAPPEMPGMAPDLEF